MSIETLKQDLKAVISSAENELSGDPALTMEQLMGYGAVVNQIVKVLRHQLGQLEAIKPTPVADPVEDQTMEVPLGE